MKKVILSLLIVFSISVNAQSLKDALYGGKLKSDSGSVIRKTDDLSTKIDTNSKKRADSIQQKIAITKDSLNKVVLLKNDSTSLTTVEGNTKGVVAKNNDEILKDYMDSIISTFNAELIPDRKVKNGSYFIMVTYEIGIDGQLAFVSVLPSPDDSYLKEQIKMRLDLTAPLLSPVIFNGKPRKVTRKLNFTLKK